MADCDHDDVVADTCWACASDGGKIETECDYCDGYGKVSPCPECDGQGGGCCWGTGVVPAP